MNTNTIRQIRLAGTLLVTSFLCSCKDTRSASPLAQAAVVSFHTDLNAGKWKEIYDAASPTFRGAATEKDWLDLMDSVKRKLGKHVKSTTTGSRTSTVNLNTSTALTLNSEFELGKGTETFTYSITEGKAVLVGYNLNSMDMMRK
jgi:hypothetical protein